MSAKRDEFALIEALFAPLAADQPGALGLKDDAASLRPSAGCELVLTADAMVAGVHFLPDDPPGDIGHKLLAVNLSDLAAKGARPRGYLLTAAWPDETADDWIAAFAAGLEACQREHGLGLLGGDTVATPGPLCLSLTAIGEVPAGDMRRRDAARPGDRLWLSGSFGDGALGLKVLRGELAGLAEDERAYLVARYRRPRPRLRLGRDTLSMTHAGIDVSDGLIADLGHIAAASRAAVVLDWRTVPLSPAARQAIGNDESLMAAVLSGGDDYELALSAPPDADARLAALAEEAGIALTCAGRIEAGRGVRLADGERWRDLLARGGWRHR